MTRATGSLDFIVIGAMKSGTTSLWARLRDDPRLALPSDKERAFFVSETWQSHGMAWFLDWAFPHAPDTALLGTVTPQYMVPPLGDLPARIAAASPDVRLIALLRDPLERARSEHKMDVRRGRTTQALRQRLADKDTPLVVNGCYGAVIDHYLREFPREQLLLIDSETMLRGVAGLTSLLGYLGLEEHPTTRPLPHSMRGGTRQRVDAAALDEIAARLDVGGPRTSADADWRRGFLWWLRNEWNIVPDGTEEQLPASLERSLLERFLGDAEALHAVSGWTAPWASRYRERLQHLGT